jgi:hypothetical protein
MGLVLAACGSTAAVIGAWRGYAVAREALAPLAHDGDPTRSAIDATRPIHGRIRVRLFARRVAVSIAWVTIAMYGLYLAVVGLGMGR